MSSAALQELVEDLAGQLQAPAVIEDDELRMLAHLLSPLEELRADAMRHIDDGGLRGLREPVITVVVRTARAAMPLSEPMLAQSLRDATRGRRAGT